MKIFFDKSYNILFALAAVIFLQFLSAVICFYAETVTYFSFGDWSAYFYMAYCLAVCVISAIFILKKRESFNIAKLWVAGFFLYAFCEILFFIKIMCAAYDGFSGFSVNSESVYNLWDNQYLYRLHVCISVTFLIFCALFVMEKKKLYIGCAGINLFVFLLLMAFIPGGESLLIYEGASVVEVAVTEIVREAGILTFMLNIFIFSLYKFYNYKES